MVRLLLKDMNAEQLANRELEKHQKSCKNCNHNTVWRGQLNNCSLGTAKANECYMNNMLMFTPKVKHKKYD